MKIKLRVWTFVVCCVLCLAATPLVAQDADETVYETEESVAEEMAEEEGDKDLDRSFGTKKDEAKAGQTPRSTMPRRSAVPRRSSAPVPAKPPVRVPPQPKGTGLSRTRIPTPRPKAPAPRPKALVEDAQDGDVTQESISFNYRDEDLINVIEAIGRITGKAFDIDPSIGATKVTVITHDAIPPEMAFEVLESILYVRNFSMKETLGGYMINVVPMGHEREKQPVFKGMELPPGYDSFSTHIVAVQHARALDVAQFIQNLGSTNAKVDVYETTNTLLITDTADGIKRMFALLEEIDVPGYDTQIEIIVLEYTRAEVLAGQIEEVLMVGTGSLSGKPVPGRQPTPRRSTSTRRTSTPRGPSPPGSFGTRADILRIVPDERLNALIVVASEGIMKEVLKLVDDLDRPTDIEENNMHIYQLSSAKAEDVEGALSSLVGATAPRKGVKAGGGGASEDIQAFDKKVSITSYEPTNALLILASPQDYQRLKPIITQLDIPPRQVHVAATILNVTISDTWSLAIDMAAATGNDGFAVGNTANMGELFTAIQAASTLVGGDLNTAMSLALASGLAAGAGGGITAGIKDSFKVGGVKVPFVPFMLKAIETLTDSEVLSAPNIVSRDNEESKIIVGQEVPTVQSRRTSVNSGEVTSASIKREAVGVKMSVTPMISEGDYVALEIDVEVSAVLPGDPSTELILGPTFSKSQITSNIVVKDGATGIMGGLMTGTANRTRSQIPILGDIPLLGKLFQQRGSSHTKQTLIVFVTPHIIKEGIDLARVTEHSVEQFRGSYFDELYDQGIIKKVRKKNQRRNKHSYAGERLDAIFSPKNFRRGDIEK